MATACGLGLANLYYAQPLLPQIARSLGVSAAEAALLPMLTQGGFAVGVFLLAPLGDVMEKRRLILTLTGIVALALSGSAFAPSLTVLAILSFVTGVTCVISTLVLPFAVQLSAPGQRGATVGSISGAMLLGVLLSRTLSGAVAELCGWRAVYLVATLMMTALWFAMNKLLPVGQPRLSLPYRHLILSMADLVRRYPTLRHATINGFLLYGALSAFWATLSFFVSGPPYQYGPGLAGAFGVAGAASALCAPLVGRLADRRGPRTLVAVAGMAMGAAYVLLLGAGYHLAGLLAGIILLDVAAQSATISNQAIVYSLNPEAQSRMYTVYRAAYSLGGSLGAYLGIHAWAAWGWPGVCGVGLGLLGTAGVLHYAQNTLGATCSKPLGEDNY